MNYQSLLKYSTNELKKSSVKNPSLDSEIMLSNILGISRENLLLNLENNIKKEKLIKFNKHLEKRKKNKPIAYIIGKKEFWKTEFIVNSSVLVPRPETELIVEEAINLLRGKHNINLLDIGTGSGCILISILKIKKNWYGTGIDLSKNAIKVAKTNAKIQQLENRIRFVHSDIDKFIASKYDLIISNPPYISEFKLKRLDKDVKDYEPRLALDGGPKGLSEIEKVIKKSSKLLKNRGTLIIEIAPEQKNYLTRILKLNDFHIKKISKDLAGKDRCIISIKIN